ncbi:tRNA-splicing endonuclease subunit sen54 N-term-domain-containing protein [Ephemerocybe angulata]|uniref:tRNA-splicing endonuclease subunit sen54 N-term-domain-containing protein n=1 Tax=Ephemerocybe angulata TaxID=980116 RepID=A0A8H6M0J0_9AGAR|nr:tRNA-splicing endonuclease subunit sen54 N-term-domain-containing protein [Tulosesus angulatus]
MDESLELPNVQLQKPADIVAAEDDEQGSDDEDGGLDWTKLLPAALRPVIPKRGEKEYEPRTGTAGGESGLQVHVLERSRTAMFETLKATRTTSSKAISYGIWHPHLARAEVTVMKGIHFSSMGHSAPRQVLDTDGTEKLQKRLELLPEEAIYLIERGSMFCWKESNLDLRQLEGVDGVPMTVQQAYSEMIGTEDLTLEKFQVFAYLKRLGYVVTRTRQPNEHYPTAAPFSVAVSSSSVLDRVRRLFGVLASGLLRVFARFDWWHPLNTNTCFLGIRNYGSLFRSLRFIPTGHSVPLNREEANQKESPYQIFYNLYKPSTPFKKSTPPAPDFQIVVINARTTPMPTLHELTDLFDILPEQPLPLPRQKRLANSSQVEAKPVPSAPAAPLPTTGFFQRLFPWAFPTTAPVTQGRRVNPFMALKNGKKMIVIAVVDAGNIGFFKFSEGAFSEWPMA